MNWNYKTQMRLYGESYACAFYLLASSVLAVSGAGLHNLFDSMAGVIWFVCDVLILILQFLGRADDFRKYLFFAASAMGVFTFLLGSIFFEALHASAPLEIVLAGFRILGNVILLAASLAGLANVLSYKSPVNSLDFLTRKPGALYIFCHSLYLVFATGKFVIAPGFAAAGYIIACLLWLLASNAIRLKFDKASPLS